MTFFVAKDWSVLFKLKDLAVDDVMVSQIVIAGKVIIGFDQLRIDGTERVETKMKYIL